MRGLGDVAAQRGAVVLRDEANRVGVNRVGACGAYNRSGPQQEEQQYQSGQQQQESEYQSDKQDKQSSEAQPHYQK